MVDFDSTATLLQGLTADFAAAKAAVDRIDASGGTNIARAMQVSNAELVDQGDPDSDHIVILLTDGVGTYDEALTQTAVEQEFTLLHHRARLGGQRHAAALDRRDHRRRVLPGALSRRPARGLPADR